MSNNNKEAFTGGQWSATGLEIRHKQRSLLLATVYQHLPANQSKDEALANARLMAEAPAMYQLIQDILNDDKLNGILTYSERVEAKAIINRINK